MNDRHPSGIATPPAPAPDAASAQYASYGPQGGQYGEFTTYADSTAAFTADPLFGNLPDDAGTGSYHTGQWSTGSHDTFGTGTHQTPHYDPYAAQHHAAFDTGAHDTAEWAAGYQQLAAIPAQAPAPDATGQWDAQAWLEAEQSTVLTQQWEWGTQNFDTGAYDATQWNSAGSPEHETEQAATGSFEHVVPEPFTDADPFADAERFADAEPFGHRAATATFDQLPSERPTDDDVPSGTVGDVSLVDDQEERTPVPSSRAASRAASRSRRRTPARRSALLTVAVPSVCVMGVAGIAAATVGVGGDDGKDTTASAADTPVKPSAANNKLDSQLANLSAGANDFADRASRTQERIDLKAQQVAEQKKAAAEAALKERLRPKFALPVLQKGLSAYFGQAGVNWMSVHTGIDFPVSYGTTVMAATDGTVQTKWNSAYGNMLIVTAKDGTQTWYCHLSSYRVPSGATVKAGQPIAYSGNSGNSTGPHLHFEVRPSGGAAIDPLPWLRSHGLDPT
ncbi:M23 family metallopeptidase [Streptomyces sp. NPDC001848]|uniref:M23 family metallopeptidase n=1 Tax=Streptomyces sp. NPDC001848 TaxID=3364618 RepID=UPI0036C8F3AD